MWGHCSVGIQREIKSGLQKFSNHSLYIYIYIYIADNPVTGGLISKWNTRNEHQTAKRLLRFTAFQGQHLLVGFLHHLGFILNLQTNQQKATKVFPRLHNILFFREIDHILPGSISEAITLRWQITLEFGELSMVHMNELESYRSQGLVGWHVGNGLEKRGRFWWISVTKIKGQTCPRKALIANRSHIIFVAERWEQFSEQVIEWLHGAIIQLLNRSRIQETNH